MCFGRGFPLVGLILVTGLVVLLAALTSWWVLLALFPLVMMAGCMATMGALTKRARSGEGSRTVWSDCCRGRPLEGG